jgi:hypothetical protein
MGLGCFQDARVHGQCRAHLLNQPAHVIACPILHATEACYQQAPGLGGQCRSGALPLHVLCEQATWRACIS